MPPETATKGNPKNTDPTGAIANCKDGTYSHAKGTLAPARTTVASGSGWTRRSRGCRGTSSGDNHVEARVLGRAGRGHYRSCRSGRQVRWTSERPAEAEIAFPRFLVIVPTFGLGFDS